jgi:hypothetical protein
LSEAEENLQGRKEAPPLGGASRTYFFFFAAAFFFGAAFFFAAAFFLVAIKHFSHTLFWYC